TIRVATHLREMAAIDPQLVVDAAAGLSGDLRALAHAAGLSELVETDAPAALNRVQEIAAPTERERVFDIVVASFGRADPKGAIHWLDGLGSPTADSRDSVYRAVAAVDPLRAVDAFLTDGNLRTVPTWVN